MTDLRQMANSVGRVISTRYPRFLFGLPLAAREIPIFYYHDIEPRAFARDLEFLAKNGYRTLRLEEFIQAQNQKTPLKKAVLLTFDDARKNFWQVAAPVLREFNSFATLFAPTFWVDDASRGGTLGQGLFMDWNELRDCANSGYVDVQSHAHRHTLVFTSDRLLGFANPEWLARYDFYDWPMRHAAGVDGLGRPPLGSPVYSAFPLLSAEQRYLENEDVVNACTTAVERGGGAAFFERDGWQAELRALHAARSASAPGRIMSSDAFAALVESEFEYSRSLFQQKLGYAPQYIAYPWRLGSHASLGVAKRHGVTAAFGVAMDYRKSKAPDLPIPVYGRLRPDYLQLLPGNGRTSLIGLVAGKISGFSTDQYMAQ
jgi:hypothetical protein